MLTELCGVLKNYFLAHREDDIHKGVYSIINGDIGSLDFLQEGQYFRIVGSVFNDGVHQYHVNTLKDEVFDGAVWAMSVPPDVVALSDEIDAWNADNASVLSSPFSSESFGGYSYSKVTNYGGGESSVMNWQNQFADRLSRYRRLSAI